MDDSSDEDSVLVIGPCERPEKAPPESQQVSVTASSPETSDVGGDVDASPQQQHTIDLSELDDRLRQLRFPRCCIAKCGGTDWFGSQGVGGTDDDSSFDCNLLPLPRCCCHTVLATAVPREIYSDKPCADPVSVLSKVTTYAFPHLAICNSCLPGFIEASQEVIKHDYRQSHIPNGQPDVKFSVGMKCPQCSKKYRPQDMEALLRTNGQSGCKPVKIKGQPSTSWFEAMEPTIRLIGWAKRQARSERKAQRSSGRSTSRVWENQKAGLGGYGSSDDCYSLSDDSGDEFESVVRVAVAKGELKEELMKKDPKFRMSVEDEVYVAELIEREKDAYAKRKAEEEDKNLEVAQKLQEQFNKTQSSIRSPAKKRTIIDALRGQSSKKSCRGAETGSKFSGKTKTHVPDFGKKKKTEDDDEDDDDDFSFSSAASNSRRRKDEENEKVTELVVMGFSRDSSKRALRDSEGDLDLAVSMLLSENG